MNVSWVGEVLLHVVMGNVDDAPIDYLMEVAQDVHVGGEVDYYSNVHVMVAAAVVVDFVMDEVGNILVIQNASEKYHHVYLRRSKSK